MGVVPAAKTAPALSRCSKGEMQRGRITRELQANMDLVLDQVCGNCQMVVTTKAVGMSPNK